jgi:hypothetical protein
VQVRPSKKYGHRGVAGSRKVGAYIYIYIYNARARPPAAARAHKGAFGRF